jgi:hypothetical protein
MKLFTSIAFAIAIMFTAMSVSAGERVYREGIITVPAAATAVTNIVVLPENPAIDYRSIDRVVASMSSGTATGTVAFVLFDLEKTTTIDTSSALTTAGAIYTAQPKYAYSYSQIINSYASTTTNLTATAVVSTNTVNIYQPYSGRIMKVIGTLNAASTTATVLKYGIFAE